MAIKNASDLLVYTKTGATKQVTRIYVKTTTPFTFPGSASTAVLAINNITGGDGKVYDGINTGQAFSNTGADALLKIKQTLDDTGYDYAFTDAATSGDYTYRDFTNAANGLVPTLELVPSTAASSVTFKTDSVIIEILTPGSSAVLDPVAFSTSASFSTNMDLRDVTTKDSDGWSESVGGLKSFEVSTELLQTLNPDHPIDGTDFINKLKERSLVNVSFSDRIRNLLTTNLVKSGVDNFTESGLASETYNQADPFGGTTATQLATPASTSSKYITYSLANGRIEDKKLTLSFYVKGIGSNQKASIFCNRPFLSVTKLSGDGSYASENTQKGIISGLSTDTNSNPANWTRMEATIDTSDMSSVSQLQFYLYPGDLNSQNLNSIVTSSWQFELKGAATDYQDPTKVNRWQGDALVTSVSFDAGVEDNLTCSATFTGTATNTYNT